LSRPAWGGGVYVGLFGRAANFVWARLRHPGLGAEERPRLLNRRIAPGPKAAFSKGFWKDLIDCTSEKWFNQNNMNILIHDLENFDERTMAISDPDNTKIISDNGKIHPCICCFGCWIKTPGRCVINDGYDTMGLLLSKCERLVIISRCFYGSYSPFAHNVLDRSIPYLLPYFATKNGETHHKNRYDNAIMLTVCFYGNISDREKETARKLVEANGINFFAKRTEISFYDKAEDMRGVL
jgi:hypothetical protein